MEIKMNTSVNVILSGTLACLRAAGGLFLIGRFFFIKKKQGKVHFIATSCLEGKLTSSNTLDNHILETF